jgi:hypothetical protein
MNQVDQHPVDRRRYAHWWLAPAWNRAATTAQVLTIWLLYGLWIYSFHLGPIPQGYGGCAALILTLWLHPELTSAFGKTKSTLPWATKHKAPAPPRDPRQS